MLEQSLIEPQLYWMILEEENEKRNFKIWIWKRSKSKNQSRINQSQVEVGNLAQKQCLTGSHRCIDWATVVLNDHWRSKSERNFKIWSWKYQSQKILVEKVLVQTVVHNLQGIHLMIWLLYMVYNHSHWLKTLNRV